MAEITWKFPSSIQYGQMKVVFEVDEPDYFLLGKAYAKLVKDFREGEESALQEEREQASKALTGAREGKAKAEPEKAAQTPSQEDAEGMIKSGLGATKLDETVYDEPVAEKPKPWQSNKPSFNFDN